MREMGMTRIPTSMSATASDLRKKLVAFWSFFSNDTASITRMLPPIVSAMMIRISSAGQFFSLIIVLVTDVWVKLSRPALMAATPPPPTFPHDRVWFTSMGLLLGHTIRPPTSKEEVVVPNPPRRTLAGPPITETEPYPTEEVEKKGRLPRQRG